MEITVGVRMHAGIGMGIVIAVGGRHGVFWLLDKNSSNQIISETISCSLDEQLHWQFIP